MEWQTHPEKLLSHSIAVKYDEKNTSLNSNWLAIEAMSHVKLSIAVVLEKD